MCKREDGSKINERYELASNQIGGLEIFWREMNINANVDWHSGGLLGVATYSQLSRAIRHSARRSGFYTLRSHLIFIDNSVARTHHKPPIRHDWLRPVCRFMETTIKWAVVESEETASLAQAHGQEQDILIWLMGGVAVSMQTRFLLCLFFYHSLKCRKIYSQCDIFAVAALSHN